MRKRKFFVLAIIVVSILLSTFALYFYQIFTTPNVQVEKEDGYLLIPTGASFQTVQDSLKEGDYVKDLVAFSFLAKLLDYDENVKPGRYLLTKNMSNLAAVRKLRSGLQEPVNLTFNNIRLKDELAEKICKNIEANEEEFVSLLKDPEFLKQYGFNNDNVMTMFIPNTYELFWTTDAKELFERMNKEYLKFWTDERKRKAEQLRLSPVEVSILASIVMAESNRKDESPKIAGLYLNRLQQGMPLQADPTLVFAAGDFTIKRVLTKHMEIESPYNTYKYAGLPPGPINLPSISAIDAVLNHEKHEFIYMCAKEDFSGYHNFASNYQQHVRNANIYRRALDKAKLFQ